MDPVTIVAGITVLGAAISAIGAIRKGGAERRQADFQSTILRQQAAQTRRQAEGAEEDFRRQQARLFATRRAALGGSGVQPATGSPLLGSEDFASEVELSARRIRGGGELQATRLEQQAALEKFRGREARTAGFVRGGSLLVSGAGKAFF